MVIARRAIVVSSTRLMDNIGNGANLFVKCVSEHAIAPCQFRELNWRGALQVLGPPKTYGVQGGIAKNERPAPLRVGRSGAYGAARKRPAAWTNGAFAGSEVVARR